MIELKTHTSLESIGPDRWNALNASDYPFLRYEFLHALEQSGAVSRKTGWQPLHLEWSRNGQTIACLPCYLKEHSYGEYVFDWSWADAYQRNGLNYYPKLVSAIPFTPAYGPRWVSALSDAEMLPLLTDGIAQLADQLDLESWHLLFPEPSLMQQERPSDSLLRTGVQYHWFNQNYSDFDAFLANFTSRKRKDLKKERRRIVESGIGFRRLTGDQVSREEIEIFYQFYAATYLKRGRPPYLNLNFFLEVFSSMPEQILLVLAEKEGQPIAGALSFRDQTTLYGRYWGCLEEYDLLHFETCYYQGVEHCIEQGIERFDPGAQGEHKIKRGFTPITTCSLHWIRSKPFRDAIDRFLSEERQAMEHHRVELHSLLPFKETDKEPKP